MLKTIKMWTIHFNERMLQRFNSEDIPHLERTIEKAIEKALPGEKIRYTHPAWGITVVVHKIGLNGGELITCWNDGDLSHG